MAAKTNAKTKITEYFGKSPSRLSNKQSTKSKHETVCDEKDVVNGKHGDMDKGSKQNVGQDNDKSVEKSQNNGEVCETQGEIEMEVDSAELHFPCSNCDFITGDENEIIKHMTECSESEELNTQLLKTEDIIQQITEYEESQETVNDDSMSEMQYPCSNCDYFTSDLNEIAVHMATCTGEENTQAAAFDIVGKENFSNNNLIAENDKIELHYTCSNCDFIGTTEDEVLVHMKECPDDYELKSQPYYTVYRHDLVKKTYKFVYSSQDQESNKKSLVTKAIKNADSKQKLKKMRILDNIPSLSTKQKTLKSESAYNIMKKEKIRLSGKKEYVCDICNFTTDNKFYIEQHLTVVHSDDKPIECEICGYRCKRQGDLKSHMLVHQEKVYNCICNICGWATYKKSKLKVHMRMHSGDKPYKCELCDYASHKTDGLSSHMKTHSLERPHKCDICGKSFKQSHNLNSHRLIHTGNQPKKHPCTVCDYVAVTPHILKHHLLTHTDEKPYKCPKCDYRCKIKSNLKCHMTKHSNKKPYICFECGFSTKLPQTLQRHMKIHKREHCAQPDQADSKVEEENTAQPAESENLLIKCEF